MRGTNVILPVFSHVEVRKAEIQGRPHPMETHRAHYASVLTDELMRRFKTSGEVDCALADRIEAVLWPSECQREGGDHE